MNLKSIFSDAFKYTAAALLSKAQSAPEFRFSSRWSVNGTVEEVYEILQDAEGLARWWPAVYLNSQILKAGKKDRVGEIIDFRTKSWLPFTLDWQGRLIKAEKPHRLVLEAFGDIDGVGVWNLQQNGEKTELSFVWQVRARKPLIQKLTFLLKPLLEANHRWAMEKGLLSLKLELARRKAKTPAQKAKIPPPPGPSSTAPFLLGTIALLGITFLLFKPKPKAK